MSLYVAGSSAEQVADAVGLSVDQVGRLVEEVGVKRSRSDVARLAHAPAGEPPAGPSEWPADVQAEVLERYAQGQSGEVIATMLELPASSVYRVLRERGVLRTRREAGPTSHPRGPRAEPERKAPAAEVREIVPAELAEKVLKRYVAGEAPRVIGLALGVPGNRVYRLRRERGMLRSVSEALRMRAARRRAVD